MLKVERLYAGYGEIQVLKGISFEVGQGQVISIVGANCAGKSTLLNTISGILKPTSGRVVFEGEDLTHLPGYQIAPKGIVQVPEGRKLFPAMNVKDNLFVGASFPRARQVRQRSLEQVFKLFPVLRERMNQVAETLSGGEQQMVAIGRALMAAPRLLILDEPSLGLAPMMMKEVFHIIERLHQQEKITLLLVEQNLKHALALSHYAYVLENGRIVLEGSGQAIMNNEHTRKAYLGI